MPTPPSTRCVQPAQSVQENRPIGAKPRDAAVFVPIAPAPKGSTRSFVSPRTGRVVTQGACKRTKEVEAAIRYAVQQEWKAGTVSGPVALTVVFSFRQPKSAKKRHHPTVKPDIDKLLRTVLDALTGVVYYDDAQVISVAAQKTYSDEIGIWIYITCSNH